MRARTVPAASRPAAAFLAHLLAGRARPAPRAGAEADGAYRRAEQSDAKRLPAGYRKSLSA